MTTTAEIKCAHGEVWPLDKLIEHPRNPNKHPAEQLRLLGKIILATGWRSPIVVSERSGYVIKGHGRLQAARLAGLTEAPVDVQEYPDEAAELADMVADNRLAEMAEMDLSGLKDLLQEMDTGALDMELFGFGEDALAGLMSQFHVDGEADADPQIDRAEELRVKWGVEAGQLWQLGDHRLLCGDAKKAEDVGRVMGGEEADAVLTDPPYGQNQDGVPGDAPKGHTELMRACIKALPISNGVVVSFQSPRTFHAWTDAARARGFAFERMLWLYKAAQCTFPWRGWILKSESIPVCSIGRPDWQEVHPFAHDCYYLAEVSGELAPGSGWHGAVKPLAVVSDLLARICKAGSIVFDPFVGSGTTIIACENLGRRCFAMEISPGYVAVSLERWANASGKTPVLSNG